MNFSVLIPAYNCEAQLERLLKNLETQTFPKENYEILVVDDGSTDGTAEKAEQMGARVIRHQKNLGRVCARESAAKNAKYETLVFIDARLTIEDPMLENAEKLNYTPLMGVGGSDKTLSIIDRVFYCIRRRTYWPYEPQFLYGKELWLKPDEFDGRPKGTGLLIIDRKMFLDCALEDKNPDVNDDTRLLRRIVNEGRPILRHTDLTFFYEHRHHWPELLRHTFYRGPKFLDYYLSPGGPYFIPYLFGCLLLIGLIPFCFIHPMSLIILPCILLLLFIVTCVWLAEEFIDFFACLFFFPPVAIAFISGIFAAQLARITGLRKLIRQ